MKCLIRERLSEHKYKTPEGYLICVDSILARTGKQSYRRSELFQDGDDSEIDVDRPESEVFSPATLASFENKPIVVEHPDEDVNANNIKQYAVGFVRDVKRGKTEDGQDVMLGTLVIQDADTIREIENGEHTDLSCGYDCDIADEANPTQRNIRGNHVALCAQGRAGIAKIVDSAKILDFDAQLQENKLSKTSIEYRKKLNEQPQNKKALLLEAENIIKQIVDDTDAKDKAVIQKYADKHLADIRAFAASLKDSLITDGKDLNSFKRILQQLSKMYSNDPDILFVMKTLNNFGWKTSLEKIEGWTANRNVPGEYIKKYTLVSDVEGKQHHVLVTFYADERDWRVKEINAYTLDCVGNDESIESSSEEAHNIKKENDSMNDSKKFTIYQVTPFGTYKLVEWEADSKEEAVKEFLELNPSYKSKRGGIIADSVNDSMVGDARVGVSGEHNDIGKDYYGYFTVDHPKYGKFYVSFKIINRRRQEVQLDGTGWNFIKSKGYTPEQKQWIINHKSELDNFKGGFGEIADSVEADDIITKDSKPQDSMKDADDKLWKVYLTGGIDANNVMFVKANTEADAKRIAERNTNETISKIIEYGTDMMTRRDKEKILANPSRYYDSVNDGSPVDVLNVVQSKRDNTGKTWYLLEISMKSGTRAYIVTADYKGEKIYTGGGAVSFDLNGAKRDLDAFITINELNTKYGKEEGYKRYMAGKKDSVKDAKYRVTSYVDGKILEEKLVNSLAEAQKLAYEFEKQHGRFSTTIQFVYDSVEDADTFEEVTEKLKKNEPNVDDIINAVNAVKVVRRTKDSASKASVVKLIDEYTIHEIEAKVHSFEKRKTKTFKFTSGNAGNAKEKLERFVRQEGWNPYETDILSLKVDNKNHFPVSGPINSYHIYSDLQLAMRDSASSTEDATKCLQMLETNLMK